MKQREALRKVKQGRNTKEAAMKDAEVKYKTSESTKARLIREVDNAETAIIYPASDLSSCLYMYFVPYVHIRI